MKELNKHRFLALMDRCTSALIHHIAGSRDEVGLSKVAMLCFGRVTIAESEGDGSISISPCCYVPGSHIDIFGRKQVYAIRMTKAEAEWVEDEDNLFQDD